MSLLISLSLESRFHSVKGTGKEVCNAGWNSIEAKDPPSFCLLNNSAYVYFDYAVALLRTASAYASDILQFCSISGASVIVIIF